MKHKILFIDDDPETGNLLNQFFCDNENYEHDFTTEPGEFIELLKQKNIDLVCADLHMPGKNGIELLRKVKDEYPHIIRLLFSNNLERNLSAEAAQVSHLTLLKPFDKETLFNLIGRTELIKKYLDNPDIVKLINGMSELPTMPETYRKLDMALSEESLSLHKIGEIISHDISFTTKILKIVNSSFFGLAKQISDPVQAVNFLGRNILKSLLLFHQISIKSTINKKMRKYFEEMWHHGNKVGRFAKEVIHKTLGEELEMMEDAYIAGLLHDIGKIILLEIKEYPENVFEVMGKENIRYSAAEQKLYNTSHAEVGAYFLALWGMPERIVHAVLCHKECINTSANYFTFQKAVCIGNLYASLPDFDLHNLKELRLNADPVEWLNHYNQLKENPEGTAGNTI